MMEDFGPIPMSGSRRSIESLLAPLRSCIGLQFEALGLFGAGAQRYSLPKFTYRGPNSMDPIRIGIFAGIHGDEPAGVLAGVELLRKLVQQPQLAEGFHLHVYPLCNPTGFEDDTRQCAAVGT